VSSLRSWARFVATSVHGKPLLAGGGALPELGVDLEAVVPVRELEDVARHHSADEERRALLSLPSGGRTAAFHQCSMRTRRGCADPGTSGLPLARAGTRRLSALLGLMAIAACAEPARTGEVTGMAVPDSALPPATGPDLSFTVDTIARGLEVPWGLAELPDGRWLVTERPGRIRVIRDGALDPEPWAVLDVYAEQPGIGPEAGLLGLALAPDFAVSGHVYVVATTWRSPGDRERALVTRLWRRVAGLIDPTANLRYKNQVLRFTERDGKGGVPEVVVDDLAATYYHAGGGIAFGPDGALYVSMGDALLPAHARRGDSHLGRVLRYAPDGRVPADNPFPGAPTFAKGLRNTQAFTWLDDGTMVGAEHGPTGMPQEGGRAGHDELNALLPGADYGWPDALGGESESGSRPALWTWREPIAPGGVAVYDGPIEPWRGSLLVAGLRGRLERVVLEKEGGAWRVVAAETLLDRTFGRLRAVRVDRNGMIYLTTSNRDARGRPSQEDDLLLRLRPEPNAQ
jgi:glucose/arabinose dehydrogenase